MSFDLFVYLPDLQPEFMGRVERALAKTGLASTCSADTEGTIEIEFSEMETTAFVEISPMNLDSMGGLERLTPKQLAQLKACRSEAMVMAEAMTESEMVKVMTHAAVAMMEAGAGVLHDPQASASEFDELGDLVETVPGVSDGYFFESAHARRWADAMNKRFQARISH